MTFSDLLKTIKGENFHSGFRYHEAHELFLNMLKLDYPHLHVHVSDESNVPTVIKVGGITLIQLEDKDTLRFDIAAYFPDDAQTLALGVYRFETTEDLLCQLVSFTWIDPEVGVYPSMEAFRKAVVRALDTRD